VSAVVAALVAGGAPAWAQSGTGLTLSETDFLSEIPRVFSGARMPQAPADSPGAVTVIDREMIRASGARDLADLFRLVPGFQVGMSTGGRPVVTYHGLSGQISQRMQVLVDGRSLYAPYSFGGIDWGALSISLEDIERIEVLRGSNSASYGANAFMSVANIITRTAAQSAGFQAQVAAGSDGIRDGSFRLGDGGGRWQWRLSGGTKGDDGLVGRQDNRRVRFLDLRSELQLNERDELTFMAGFNSSRFGIGFARTPSDPERTEQTESSYLLARLRRTVSADHELSLTFSRTSDRGQDRFEIPASPTQNLVVDYGRRAVRSSLEYQHYLELSRAWRASWGAEYRRDSVKAPQLFNTRSAQNTESVRAYTNFEWRPLPAWTFNAGGLVEHDQLAGTQFAPRVAANWKFTPNQTLKLGYSGAFRTPSLFEQRSDWRFVFQGRTIDIRYLSRGGLEPERVRAMELAYLGEWREPGLSVDARLFRERVTDLITQELYTLPPGQDQSEDAYDLRNADSATISGLEYQLKWRPTPRALLAFSHYMARRSGSEDFVRRSIPAHSGSLFGSYNLSEQTTLSASYSWSAPIHWIGERTAADAQRELGLRLAHSLRLSQVRGQLALVVRHPLGNNAEFRVGQRMPEQAWISLSLEY
jgi:iron complex outermembrane receptor protein